LAFIWRKLPSKNSPLIFGIVLFLGIVNTVRGFSFGRVESNKVTYNVNELVLSSPHCGLVDGMHNCKSNAFSFKVKLFVVKTQYQSQVLPISASKNFTSYSR
jgi:hypothetical protein